LFIKDVHLVAGFSIALERFALHHLQRQYLPVAIKSPCPQTAHGTLREAKVS
jgi:hypothetical protein